MWRKKWLEVYLGFNISVLFNSNYTRDIICSLMISMRVIASVSGRKLLFRILKILFQAKYCLDCMVTVHWFFFYIQDGFSYIFGCFSKGKGELSSSANRNVIPFICSFLKLKLLQTWNYLLEILWNWKNRHHILIIIPPHNQIIFIYNFHKKNNPLFEIIYWYLILNCIKIFK